MDNIKEEIKNTKEQIKDTDKRIGVYKNRLSKERKVEKKRNPMYESMEKEIRGKFKGKGRAIGKTLDKFT